MAEAERDSFSEALNGRLSNPEMMSMISSMASKLKGETTGGETEEPQAATPGGADKAAGLLAPLLSGELGGQSQAESDRNDLLRALKPFLSPSRSEAVDRIIKFSRISDVLKKLS